MDFQNPYAVIDIALLDLLRNMGIGLILAVVWSLIVSRSSRLVVDTRQYLPIFILLIPSMILIISIIKSSIALSLGLVGALSIVRFRTPIKEPEELLYLFVAIAVGLGLGANQLAATLIGFVTISFGMIFLSLVNSPSSAGRSTYIDLVFPPNSKETNLSDIENVVKELKYKFGVKKVYSSDGRMEILIDIASFKMSDFSKLQSEIQKLNSDVKISAMENARIIT